jgi:thiol-disulfide isomerase/thioredoxin
MTSLLRLPLTALLLGAALTALPPRGALAQAPENGDAEWERVVDLLGKPGALFREKAPASREEFEAIAADFQKLCLEAADAAVAFRTQFPHSRLRHEARMAELEMLAGLARFSGEPDLVARLLREEDALLADAGAPDEFKYNIEMRRALEKIDRASFPGRDELAEAEQVLAPIFTRYPDRPDTYAVLLSAAENAPPERALAVARRVAESPQAPPEARERAQGMAARLSAVGKPIDLRFTALDGRAVDVAAMTNRVVLIDFWATWCGPCVRELPRLLELHQAYHPRGFEIVGVSLDEDREALEKFVADRKIPWPQAFDGKGWASEHARAFGVTSIPSLWLVNRGKVVSTDARADLEEFLKTLLPAPQP